MCIMLQKGMVQSKCGGEGCGSPRRRSESIGKHGRLHARGNERVHWAVDGGLHARGNERVHWAVDGGLHVRRNERVHWAVDGGLHANERVHWAVEVVEMSECIGL